MPKNKLDPEKVNEASRHKRRWWHWLIPFVWRDTYERTLKQLHEAHEKNSALENSRDALHEAINKRDTRIRNMSQRITDLDDENHRLMARNQRLNAQLQEIGLQRGADGKFKSRGEKA